MRIKSTKLVYGETLAQGDTVYFLEQDGAADEGRPSTVRKGSVYSTETPRGGLRVHPQVNLWDDPNKDPEGIGLVVGMAPSALFKEEDLKWAAAEYDGPPSIVDRPVDEVLGNIAENRQLARFMGSLAVIHQAPDDLNNIRLAQEMLNSFDRTES